MKPAIIGIAGPALTLEERALLRRHRPRGVILFARNIETPAQLKTLNDELRELLPDGEIMLDQEGGRVARLRPPFWPDLPPAAHLQTAAEAYAHGAALGAMVREAGFTVTAAPVLDLLHPGANEVIGDRAISGTAAQVAELGGQIAAGIMDAGIIPVMKHIPGHGRALVDSHLHLPRIAAADLSQDFLPFMVNRQLPWAMTAHVIYEAYDMDYPATISRLVIARVIRGMIGFTGTLISDDLAMQALTGTPAARATAALAAGCDIALYCPGDMAGNISVLEAL